MTTLSDSRVIEQFEQAHAELEHRIDEWRAWWRELRELGTPRFNEMGTRLRSFREQLKRHMVHEETCAFLRDAAHGDPRQRHSADHLWQQHHQLLERLDELIKRLEACEPSYDCWGAARQDFECWLNDLHDHERLEIQWMRTLLLESRAEEAALRQND
jgi:iron-sulfur cluster repair protein YtfE (RIC family)